MTNNNKRRGAKAGGGRPREPDQVSQAIHDESQAWRTCRISGECNVKACTPATAKREADLLIYLACEVEEPITSLRDLLEPSVARRVLDRLQHRLTSVDTKSWGAMAYEAARTLYKTAASDFYASLGHEPIAKDQVKAMRKLKTRYSPKGNDAPLYLPNILRPFTSRERAQSLLALPSKILAALPKCGPVSIEERKARSDAFALRLVMEMPEKTALLAGLTRAHLKVFECAGQPTIAVFSTPEQTGEAIGQLSGEAAVLYQDFNSRVLNLRPSNPFLFVGRSGAALSPPGFRRRIVDVTKDQLQLKKGLSVRDLRWIIAFIHLAHDANSRDLVASYLGHKKRKDIEPLLKLVEDWRRSGALASYTQHTVGGVSDNDQ